MLFTIEYKCIPPSLPLRPTLLPANRRVAESFRRLRQNVLTCLLALLGVLLPAVEAPAQDLSSDKVALEAVYNATGGANWTDNTNWLSSQPVGDWHGVTVSNGRVTRLSLANNGLTGSIPTDLGNLDSLERLVLSNNQLTGAIPTQLGNLARLETLYLDNNQLTGTLPPSFTGLVALDIFHFHLNPGLCAQFTSAIQTWLNKVSDVQGPDCSPAVLLSVTPTSLFEDSGATSVTVTATRQAVTTPTTVALRRGGSAQEGVGLDYTVSGNESITIPADATSGTTQLTFTPLADGLAESDENIILEAVVGAKTEGSVTLRLIDEARACAARDRIALEALYNATDGTNWTSNTNWLSDKPLSEWHGVTVDANGCVTELQLATNQMTGPISAELGNLAKLQVLDLSDNPLTGPIPTELGNLALLQELRLRANQLSGSIPAQLGNLAKLRVLYIANTDVTGPIPAQLGNLVNLEVLGLYAAELTGPIPAELGNLANLQNLSLFSNSLTGTIPTKLGNFANLQNLDLGGNQLTGSIPSQLANLASLRSLGLHGNRFTGSIPPQLGNLAKLQMLLLSDNQLTGTIPTQLGNLDNLEKLLLSGNQLTGSIPPQLGSLARLQTLYLDNNQLTGTLPSSFTGLVALSLFHFNLNPGLCAQDSGAIRTWLNGVNDVRGPDCSPAVLLSVNPSSLFEDSGATPVTVTATRQAVSNATTVTLRRGGSAQEGAGLDYAVSGTESITIPANATSGTTLLTFTPLADGLLESDENIILEAVVGSKTEGSVTLSLIDTPSACAASDRLALEALYNTTGGTNWTNNTNWLSDKPLSEWHGVTLDGTGCVTELQLPDNQLTGAIPAQLGNLINLQRLDLSGNQLTGTIPTSFTGLGALNEFNFNLNPGLCAQHEAAIRTWLNGVADVQGPDCSAAQSDETAKRFHLLPHIADGDGWQSTLLVTNVAQSASACTLQLYGLGVDRFIPAASVQGSGSTATFKLPGEGAYLTWPTRNQSTLASGYATLDCTEPVVAQIVFASIDNSGSPTGMATVFSSQTGLVLQFPVLTPDATLGFAIANDTTAFAACRIVLEDPQRMNLGESLLSVPPKTNWSGTLLDGLISIPSTFDGGTATVSCTQPVAMIGLHFELRPDRSITTFNTLPPAVVVPISQSDETAKRFHLLPHIADGDGWQSTLLVTNVAQSASACTLQLYGLGVDRFIPAASVQGSGSTATFKLPGEGAYLTWPTRNQSTLASGYATLDCTEPVVAQIVFASIDNSGSPTGMATVFSSQTGLVLQFPVLTPDATLGFAIANDTTAFAACRIVLEDPQRMNLGESLLSVPPKTNWSGTLLDGLISIPSTFDGGTATVSCTQPVAMIGLHFELRPDRSIITFNTLPPAVLESVPSSPSAALETGYHATGGTKRNHRTGWLRPAPLREWFGGETDRSGRVTSLDLRCNLLSGRGRGRKSFPTPSTTYEPWRRESSIDTRACWPRLVSPRAA